MAIPSLQSLAALAQRCAEELQPQVEEYFRLVWQTVEAERRVFFAGNGGSAAHAQEIHLGIDHWVRGQVEQTLMNSQ